MQPISYPFPDAPASGRTLQIAPGIHWLRMPLPMALDHINLYLLEEDDGWWIVDTGMGGARTRELWREVCAGPLASKPVKAVLVTHMHPDHVGQSGWLCDQFQVPLYMTQVEYLSARNFSRMTAEDLSWTTERYYRRLGFDDAFFPAFKARFRGFGAAVDTIPGAYTRVRDGDLLTIGRRQWRAMIGRGHSPEHLCLYCAEDQLLISGDQIIPRITSNVGVMAIEPEANPLADWLASLEAFKVIPDETLVLPSHNAPFYGVQRRLHDLIEHHRDHLDALEEACVTPRTALSLLPVLFDRKLDEMQMGMAMGECLAHLNYLVYAGRLSRQLDAAGRYQFQTCDPAVARRPVRPHHRSTGPMEV